jgi:uncharacterized membrane protein
MSKKVLIAGESWTSFTTHIKGADSFTTSVYQEGVQFLRAAIEKAGYEVVYIPNHLAQDQLPFTVNEYKKYGAVILSDIGSNTLLLPSLTFSQSQQFPNRCQILKDYVLEGGAFIMIGGYMSFSGIDSKARYGNTSIADILPVQCLSVDDREEHSEGLSAKIVMPEHPLVTGIVGEWPVLLGYNKTKIKQGCDLVVKIGEDPLVATGNFGKGRSAVFTSDCSPHWAPPVFTDWVHYEKIWSNILSYIIK